MRKQILFILIALLILSLCACSAPAGTVPYTVTKNGTDFTVDPENGTIFDGTNTYSYSFSSTYAGSELEFIYPDGSSWWWREENGFGVGGWSNDYHGADYIPGEVLQEIVEAGSPKQSAPRNLWLNFVLLAIGIFYLAVPRAAWFLVYGWRYKDAEPSDIALTMSRISGALLIILAVILLFT